MLGLMDPGLSQLDLNRYISKASMLARQAAVNPRNHYALTENKMVFYQHCVDNNLPTPRVLGIWSSRRDWPGQVPTVDSEAAWHEFIGDLDASELVIKPIGGVHGESVMLLDRDRGQFRTHSGQLLDADGLLAEMRAADYSHWMIQERLYAHPNIQELSGSKNLQTARIVSWVDDAGAAQVLFAWLRINGGSESLDNFNFGASGNFVATLDLNTATIRYVLGLAEDGLGLMEVDTHPLTGKRMPEFRIPTGHTMFDIVKRAAGCFAPLRTIGWDVAITTDGVALVEGNVTWDPLPTREDLAAIAELR